MSNHGLVIIVDDNEVVREVITNVVKKLGFTSVIEVENGEEAWSEIQKAVTEEKNLRLLISDIDMPTMNGLQLLDKVRKQGQTNHLPVILLTAHAEREVIIQAVYEGVSGYIIKPFDMETVRKRIVETLDKAEQIKKAA